MRRIGKKIEKDDGVNKKILESKKIIREEKEKIKKEKKSMREKKYSKFRKTGMYKFFNKIGLTFKDDKDSYSFSEMFVVTLVSLVVGAFACFSVLTVITGGRNYLKLSKELGKFYDVYDTLIENYRDGVDKEVLIDSAIEGMVSSVGDDYTSYVDTENTEEFNELVNGTYEGIGCTIQLQEQGLTVIEVFKDSPSYKSGLKANDIILQVNDIKVTMETDVVELSDYIKGYDGKITMKIMRDKEELTLMLTRDTVETPVVTSKIYEVNNKKIGYINVSLFSSTASKQFKNNLEELEEQEIEGLVIDVRNNSGGYLTSVKTIASQLLAKGMAIYQVEKNNEREITRDKTAEGRTYPIAVIINNSSASASEILAAAIKESYGGFVVGTKSFGKGTVQQVKKLSDGSMIKYTVENWLTPDGNWINDVGIEPTHKVQLNQKYYQEPIDEYDNQLQESLSLVSK